MCADGLCWGRGGHSVDGFICWKSLASSKAISVNELEKSQRFSERGGAGTAEAAVSGKHLVRGLGLGGKSQLLLL